MNKLQIMPEQVYVYETGLIHKTLNLKTLVSIEEKYAPNRKISKKKIIVMCWVNSTKVLKLSFMIIGRSTQLRCFKNISLPINLKKR